MRCPPRPVPCNVLQKEIPELPREEQAELVDKLKAKWDDVNSRYQQLVHQTFFEHGRMVAKARLEGELDEIESDISKLTKGPIAVVPGGSPTLEDGRT